MDPSVLEHFFSQGGTISDEVWATFLSMLEQGTISPVIEMEPGKWEVVAWVKAAILRGFEIGGIKAFQWPSHVAANQNFEFHEDAGIASNGFFDRPAFPPRTIMRGDNIRIVPGGSSIRRGAYIANGVVIMPPSYINVGAHVDAGTMIDSHVLVGSCARVGKNVHLSAGVQVGGVLEPPQARPVVIEDNAFIGGLCGIFEGVIIRKNAVLASGVIITKSTRIYDLINQKEWLGEVPESAVVVPGSRPASGEYAAREGLSLQTPCIVKYRDKGTEAAVALEAVLR